MFIIIDTFYTIVRPKDILLEIELKNLISKITTQHWQQCSKLLKRLSPQMQPWRQLEANEAADHVPTHLGRGALHMRRPPPRHEISRDPCSRYPGSQENVRVSPMPNLPPLCLPNWGTPGSSHGSRSYSEIHSVDKQPQSVSLLTHHVYHQFSSVLYYKMFTIRLKHFGNY